MMIMMVVVVVVVVVFMAQLDIKRLSCYVIDATVSREARRFHLVQLFASKIVWCSRMGGGKWPPHHGTGWASTVVASRLPCWLLVNYDLVLLR